MTTAKPAPSSSLSVAVGVGEDRVGAGVHEDVALEAGIGEQLAGDGALFFQVAMGLDGPHGGQGADDAGQAHWLDQVSLKARASFLEQQQALHDAWNADMEAIIAGQNTALQQAVMQSAALLRAQDPVPGPVLTASPTPIQAQTSAPTGIGSPWAWIWAGMLLGTGATVVLTLAAAVWHPFAGP